MDNSIGENTIYDCIVVGSGISGVSFAYYLHTIGKSTLLFEEKDKIGGQIQTFKSEQDKAYWYELGAHTCYNTYTNLLKIVEKCGLQSDIQPVDKCKYVLYTDKGIRSIMSELSFFPMIFNGGKILTRSKNGKTVREYFRPIIGKSNYDRMFKNLFRAVISQKADEYPAEIFLKRRKERNKSIVRKYSFKGGLSSFLQNIIDRNGIDIKTKTCVTNIEYDEATDLFTISTGNYDSYKTRNIALAVDPKEAAKLTQNIDKPLTDLLTSVSIYETESKNVVVANKDLNLSKVAGIIPLNDDFLSVVARDVITHPNLRSFTFHFEKGQKNPDEKIDIICKVLDIDKNAILEQTSTEHILPALRLKNVDMDMQVKNVQSNPNIFLLGNYFYGVSLEDCVNRSLDEFQRFCKQSKT